MTGELLRRYGDLGQAVGEARQLIAVHIDDVDGDFLTDAFVQFGQALGDATRPDAETAAHLLIDAGHRAMTEATDNLSEAIAIWNRAVDTAHRLLGLVPLTPAGEG